MMIRKQLMLATRTWRALSSLRKEPRIQSGPLRTSDAITKTLRQMQNNGKNNRERLSELAAGSAALMQSFAPDEVTRLTQVFSDVMMKEDVSVRVESSWFFMEVANKIDIEWNKFTPSQIAAIVHSFQNVKMDRLIVPIVERIETNEAAEINRCISLLQEYEFEEILKLDGDIHESHLVDNSYAALKNKMDAIEAQLIRSIDELGPDDLLLISQCFAERANKHLALFDAMADKLLPRNLESDFDLWYLSFIVQAFGKTGFYLEMGIALADMLRNNLEKSQNCTSMVFPECMVRIAKGFSYDTSCLWHSVRHDIMSVCATVIENFDCEEIAELLRCFAKCRGTLSEFEDAFARHFDIFAIIFKPEQVEQFLIGLAEFSKHSNTALPTEELLREFEAIIIVNLGSFDAARIARLQKSFKDLGWKCSQLDDAIRARFAELENVTSTFDIPLELQRLARNEKNITREAIVELADRAASEISSYEPQDLTLVVDALARFGIFHEVFLDEAATQCILKMSAFRTVELVPCTLAFTSLGYVHAGLFDSISNAALPKLSTFSPQQLARMLYALSKRHQVDCPLFAAAVDSILKMSNKFSSTELCLIAKAYAKFNIKHEDVFLAVAKASVPIMNTFSPEELVSIAHSFARVGFADRKLFEAVYTATNPLLFSFKPFEIVEFFNALSMVSSGTHEIVPESELVNVLNRIDSFSNAEALLALEAFAALSETDRTPNYSVLFNRLSTVFASHLSGLKADETARLMHCYTSFAYQDEELFNEIAEIAAMKLSSFDEKNLLMLLTAFGKLKKMNKKLSEAATTALLSSDSAYSVHAAIVVISAFKQCGMKISSGHFEMILNIVMKNIGDLDVEELNTLLTSIPFHDPDGSNSDFVTKLADASLSILSKFNAQNIAQITFSFAELRLNHSSFFAKMSTAFIQQLENTTLEDLSLMQHAFSKLNFPEPILLETISKRISTLSKPLSNLDHLHDPRHSTF